MNELPLNGIVRIVGNRSIGTGFVVSNEGLIATCAHVLGPSRPEKAAVIFQTTSQEQKATVLAEYWRSVDSEDVAFLKIDGNLPEGVQALPLGSCEGTGEHSIVTFGYPDAGEVEGVRGMGTVLGDGPRTKTRQSLLQLSSKQITEGFSGAPVWDARRQRVIGMVTLATKRDRLGRLSETAFATPTETLRAICPELRVSEICPYRNLEVFTEKDALFFFGRNRIIEQLVERLQKDQRFLAVFGPSGCGKSSVVQAGVIPRLRKGVRGSDRWEIIVTRPTDSSFEHQVKRLGQAVVHVALIIDQFEEIFVPDYSEAIRKRVISQLTDILENSASITLIIVMRNDFYSLFMQQERLAQWKEMNRQVDISQTIVHDEVVQMIKAPAGVVGWQFEDEGLIEEIANDALEATFRESKDVGSSTVLPLLEFALTQLWEQSSHQDGVLTRDVYRRIGGVAGGITRWADEAYYSRKEQQPLVRHIFTTLVHLGDEARNVPDSRKRSELISLVRDEDEKAEIYEVVQHLVALHLLVKSGDTENKTETVEIIHDALLREWTQLRNWIAEDRPFFKWRQKLTDKVEEWQSSNRDVQKLLRGHDLLEAEGWLSKHKNLSQVHKDFIKASITGQRWAKYRRGLSIGLIAVLLLGVISATLIARTSFQILSASVTNLNSDGPASLRQAIETASPNSTIRFASGLAAGTITMADVTITKNLTIDGPGASVLSINGGNSYLVFKIDSHAAVTISGLTITGGFRIGSAGFMSGADLLDGVTGSSIYNAGSLEIRNCIVTGNKNDHYSGGGAIFNASGAAISISNSTISGNASDAWDLGPAPSNFDKHRGGGGFNNAGIAILTNSTVSGNDAAHGNGGGIFNSGTLTVQGSTISNNTVKTSGDGGGGIFNSGTLIMRDSTIDGNTVTKGEGGGIYNTGDLSVQTSTISNNKVKNGSGGGIYHNGSDLVLYDSTISSNSVTNGSGGGIAITNVVGQPKIFLSYCTIYNNVATTAGGGITILDPFFKGKVEMQYSILANNHANISPDIRGTLSVSGHNLIQDVSGTIIQVIPGKDHTAPLTGVSPKLGPLRNNGGPTQTHAVLPGSPVIGMVLCSTPTGPDYRTDQRGVPNEDIVHGCTIGSYQPKLGELKG